MARPEPSRVLHSTHAPASLLDGPWGVRYQTAKAVVPWGEATVTVTMIWSCCAALPAPVLTVSVPDPLTPGSAVMESARPASAPVSLLAAGTALSCRSSPRNRDSVVSTCARYRSPDACPWSTACSTVPPTTSATAAASSTLTHSRHERQGTPEAGRLPPPTRADPDAASAGLVTWLFTSHPFAGLPALPQVSGALTAPPLNIKTIGGS